MSAILLQNGKQAFSDANGRPLAGGRVFFYNPGTQTFKDTYQDPAGTVLNTNPIILDARGEAAIYGKGAYRQLVTDASLNLIWDQLLPDIVGDVNQFSSDLSNQTDPTKGLAMIGFIQAGAGAAGMSALTVLRNIVYPEMFGAKGDGVTDDAPAYQRALNALPEYGTLCHKQGSTYRLVNGVDVTKKGTTILGYAGQILYPKASQTYYHCLRVGASDVSIRGVEINSPTGLVRDDTGFGISVGAFDNCLIEGCTIRRTASACIWVTNATSVRIVNNNLWYPLADGIHFSDGARNFTCANNTLTGCKDDAIAVVSDVPGDGLTPIHGSITGNTIDGTVAGNGINLLGCDTVVVVGNTIRATSDSGIASYFWRLTSAPTPADWANNCLVADNIIISPAVSPANKDNNTGIFAGAFRNSTIRGNKIYAPGTSESLSPISGIRIGACQGLTIENNEIRDSVSYGVLAADDNVNEASNFTDLTIHANRFENVAKEIVRLMTAATGIGNVVITRNQAYKSGYNSGATNLVNVAKTGSNLLNMTDNINIDGSKSFYFDPATCSNTRVGDNNPETPIAWTPNAMATSTTNWGAATSSGTYVERGNMVFGRMKVTVTTIGGGTGLRFTLPKPIRSGTVPFICSGKETSLGKGLVGFPDSVNSVFVTGQDNSNPITVANQTADVSFWYERA